MIDMFNSETDEKLYTKPTKRFVRAKFNNITIHTVFLLKPAFSSNKKFFSVFGNTHQSIIVLTYPIIVCIINPGQPKYDMANGIPTTQ